MLIKNLVENKVLNKIYKFKMGITNPILSFLIFVGIIVIPIYKILNGSFIENFIIFLMFFIASAFVLNYEKYIKIKRHKALNKLRSNNKVIAVTNKGADFTFKAILNLNSEFFVNKLLYAYPLALTLKLLGISFSFSTAYNIFCKNITFSNYFATAIALNFNILTALCFGACSILALTRENIFPLIKTLKLIFMNRKNNKDYKRDLIMIIFICVVIYLFFTLLFGSVIGTLFEIISGNTIKALGYGAALLILLSMIIILSANYSTIKK
ncbi:hypothetical protein [Clostridium sp.]|uniref:hypothetical protein n=1 Tax=Clostridium sp. TaxID=1506 RepID=UPI00399507B4